MSRPTVARQVARGAERLVAAVDRARVGRSCQVDLEVPRELFRVGELARALGRRAIEFMHGVELPVPRQVPRRAKALATALDWTLMRLFPRVRLEVLPQCKLAVEPTATGWHRARERPVLGRRCTTWSCRPMQLQGAVVIVQRL